MRGAWLLLLLCLPLAAEAAPRRPPRARARRATLASKGTPGEVQYVTAAVAYLDRGAADGLSVGQALSFTRAGRGVGGCTVDTVADHFATCLVGALKKGDRFAVARRPDDELPGAPTELADPAELAARRDRVAASAHALVDFDGQSGGAAAHRFSLALGHTSWGNLTSARGPFQVQRLDGAVYDVEVWNGLRISADFSLLSFSRRPDGYRSIYQPQVVLLVRQLEVGFRRADVPFQAALGRLWTRSTPGLLVLDGAQVSYRFSDALETGLYGGLLPDPYALTITPRQFSAGAFVSARLQSGTGAASTVVQGELRAGYAVKEQLGGRVEVGLAGHLYQGKSLDAHLSAELAWGGTRQAVGGVDAARLDLGWRPVEQLRLLVGARYRGGSPTGVRELGTDLPGQRALHGDLAASWELTPWMTAALSGGVATDFGSALTQVRFGPELSFPTLLGRGSGLSLGYAEELGWLRGRTGYVQVIITAFGRLRVLSRTTWFQQLADNTLPVTPALPASPRVVALGLAPAFVNDLGQSLNLDVTLMRWLWVRASVSGRTALGAEPGNSRTAGLASFQVGGQF